MDLSAIKKDLKGKPVAVMGLGASGLSVIDACVTAGIDVAAWDDGEKARDMAQKKGARIVDFSNADMSGFAFLCLAPGIPLTHPVPHPAVTAAQQAGCEVLGDIEIFHRIKPRAKTIGITGTNGKSTTTALIYHVLQTAGVPVAMGGNIGTPVLALPDLDEDGLYVLELSSYQLDLCSSFAPSVALLINLAPDHIDRHGDMTGYIAAKSRIFRGEGTAIVGIDDADSRHVLADIRHAKKRQYLTVETHSAGADGIHVTVDGRLYDGHDFIFDLSGLVTLKGRHNWQNAAMAYAACRVSGVTAEDFITGLKTFPGLAHRQYLVVTINGVAYVNDSKATNDPAAAVALAAYNPIYWIAGGQSKESGYAECAAYIKHVRHAYLIGAAQQEMAKWLEHVQVPYTMCGTIDKAVAAAHTLAQKEKLPHAAVLLSPACASWDQFNNFEHRGQIFVDLVKKLEAERKTA